MPPEKRAQLKRLFAVEADRVQVVFPVFPTVYSAGNQAHQLEDFGYFLAVLNTGRELALRDGDRSLVVGPGSGFDAWLAWEATHQPV